MQSQQVDNKLATLFAKYGDQEFAANATKEVEKIRRNADQLGYAVTAAAFLGNEVCRLTMRTRKQLTLSLSALMLTLVVWLQPCLS